MLNSDYISFWVCILTFFVVSITYNLCTSDLFVVSWLLQLKSYIFISSISGSGLHTFVLYLGPHIAFFTMKAMQCGRVDLKSAPYDTIQLKRGPSWLDKECSEFGPPLFFTDEGARVPLSSILPQVQIEAILWGIGTALGELPPYFISRAGTMILSYIYTTFASPHLVCKTCND